MQSPALRDRFLKARQAALLRQGRVPFERVQENQRTMRAASGQPAPVPAKRIEWATTQELRKLFCPFPMRGGQEHRVSYLGEQEGRVVKAADTGALATESLEDYLTDIVLANYYFGDDIRILGTSGQEGRTYVLTSQPYIDGVHPDWEELKPGLTAQGLLDASPGARSGDFSIEDEKAGLIHVIDLHVNNAVRDASGWLHPIDVHFYFDNRKARMEALKLAGWDAESHPLIAALLASNPPPHDGR